MENPGGRTENPVVDTLCSRVNRDPNLSRFHKYVNKDGITYS